MLIHTHKDPSKSSNPYPGFRFIAHISPAQKLRQKSEFFLVLLKVVVCCHKSSAMAFLFRGVLKL